MDMNLNISATLNIFRVIAKPSLCLPHATISTFNQLPVPLDSAFEGRYGKGKVDIKAVVLDKDNCFAWPKENGVWKDYEEKFHSLKEAYPGRRLLIVSNTAGSSQDPSRSQSQAVTAATGVPVLSHSTKKPGCGPEIMDYFRQHPETGVTRPDQIAIVGDRLSTDVLMANMMGSYAVFVRDGVIGKEQLTLLAKMEQSVGNFLLKRGFEALDPRSPFEK